MEHYATSIVTKTGRVRTHEADAKGKSAPHSCTLYVWNNNLYEALEFATRALKHGAGVKIVFPVDTELDIPIKGTISQEGTVLRFSGDNNQKPYSERWVYTIEDSIEGLNGILDAFFLCRFVTSSLGVILDFSKLRPAGTVNSDGLIASGPQSFIEICKGILEYRLNPSILKLLQIFGTLNDVLRRGGFKRGIITSSMHWRNPLIKAYLAAPIVEIAGSHKKGVIISPDVLDDEEICCAIIESCNNESTFLEQAKYNRTYANVCMGIFLKHRGTCLIHRINLGQSVHEDFEDIIGAFIDATIELCELHVTWREKVIGSGIYLPTEQDNQVALDVMGFANLLAARGITYKEWLDRSTPSARKLRTALENAYKESTRVANQFMDARGLPLLDHIHTVEPAQNHAYQTFDTEGNTTCRGIWAPISRTVYRNSNTQERKRYYHGAVETATDVGADLHQAVCEDWMNLMKLYGRPHAISYDLWKPMDNQWLEQFVHGALPTKYYSEHNSTNQQYLRKEVVEIDDVVMCDLRDGECESCAG